MERIYLCLIAHVKDGERKSETQFSYKLFSELSPDILSSVLQGRWSLHTIDYLAFKFSAHIYTVDRWVIFCHTHTV